MKTKTQYYFFYLTLIAWANHLLLRIFKIRVKFLDNYMDDLVLLPIILGIALIVNRKFISKNNDAKFNNVLIIFAWVYFCVMFELILPNFSKSFTADWIDCVAYGIGAFYFKKLINT